MQLSKLVVGTKSRLIETRRRCSDTGMPSVVCGFAVAERIVHLAATASQESQGAVK